MTPAELCVAYLQSFATGDADAIVPIEGSGLRTHRAVPHSQLVRVNGAPHGLNVSHAQSFNDALEVYPLEIGECSLNLRCAASTEQPVIGPPRVFSGANLHDRETLCPPWSDYMRSRLCRRNLPAYASSCL